MASVVLNLRRDEEVYGDSAGELCSAQRKHMRIGKTKKLFTVDDLYRMDKAGIFKNERVELINGEIILMSDGSEQRSASRARP